jgi:cellulose biosynthesis protein BcsQ
MEKDRRRLFMGKIIVTGSAKGGVAKTATTYNLAYVQA